MGRGTRLSLTALLAALALAPAARAALTAESMYQPGTVVSIKLELPEKSQKELEAEPKKYVRGTFSVAETEGTTVKAYSTPLQEVGIKLKGSASLKGLSEKAAFKIEFDKYLPGQSFLGLEHLTLNNMVQDASMLHETLAYDLFRANRVPATDTGFAYVHVVLGNKEEDFGMHLNVETYDRVALEKRFGPFAAPQHLYEGEYSSDVTPAEGGNLSADEGEEDDRSDLDRLVAAIAGSSPADFSDRVAPYAELQEMAHQWAVEKYAGHWDGYAGEDAPLLPNNYYLYSSAAGVFQMLPWGTDQTWERKLDWEGSAGVLFDDCVADPSCQTMYRRALRELYASLPGLGLDSLATRTATLLAPWQAMETTRRRTADAATIASRVGATRTYLQGRPAELNAFLAAHPEARAARVGVSPQPAMLPASGGSGTIAIAVSGAGGEPIFGDGVYLSASGPGVSFGPLVDEGEGVYASSFSAAPGTVKVTITATDATAGISGSTTLTVADAAPVPVAAGGGSSTGTPPAAAARPARPLVALRKRPGHRTNSRRPVFSFASDQAGAKFVCRIGDATFRPCFSPVRLPRLSRGSHVFSIAAVAPGGGRGKALRYRFFVSIRSRTRVPD